MTLHGAIDLLAYLAIVIGALGTCWVFSDEAETPIGLKNTRIANAVGIIALVWGIYHIGWNAGFNAAFHWRHHL